MERRIDTRKKLHFQKQKTNETKFFSGKIHMPNLIYLYEIKELLNRFGSKEGESGEIENIL